MSDKFQTTMLKLKESAEQRGMYAAALCYDQALIQYDATQPDRERAAKALAVFDEAERLASGQCDGTCPYRDGKRVSVCSRECATLARLGHDRGIIEEVQP